MQFEGQQLNEICEVTVIIPAYNAEKTLMRAFLSTRNQGLNSSVIIIDDCSSDGTPQISSEIQNSFPNVQFLRNNTNLGVSATRNIGIQLAKTEYISFLDADDVWLANKLIKQKRLLEKTPDCTLVTCNCLQIAPNGRVLKEGHKNRVPVSGIDAWKTLLEYNFIPTPTVFTRTELVKSVHGFDESLKVAEDLDLWIKLAKKGRVAVESSVLVHYFDYEGSLMKTGDANSANTVWNMVKSHVQFEEKLTSSEKHNIYANRLFGLAKIHLLDDVEKAYELFEEAISHGYSKTEIFKIRLKVKLKNIFLMLRR